MADVMSRIVLQAEGGDQVAREVGKVTKAYKDAGSAAGGMSGTGPNGGVSFDAFNKATFSGAGTDGGSRSQANDEYFRRTNARADDHFNRFSGGGGTGGSRRTAPGIANAAGAVVTGDVAGGTSGGLTMLAGGGAVGAMIAVLASGIITSNKLAKTSDERVAQLGHGLFQGLGVSNWDYIEAQTLATSREGHFPESSYLPYLQALKSGGGKYQPEMMTQIGDAIIAEGLTASSVAGLQASRQKAGLGFNEDVLDMNVYRGREAFGTSNTDRFIATVGTAIEGSMARGMKVGQLGGQQAYDSTTGFLSALGLAGGMSIEGAENVFNQVRQATVGTQNLGRAADVFQFMEQRIAGENVLDTQMRISAPTAELDRYRSIKRSSGGNSDLLEQRVMTEFGVDSFAVRNLINTFEDRMGPRTALGPGAGINQVDDFIIETNQRTGAKIGGGLANDAAKGWNWFYDNVLGGKKRRTRNNPEYIEAQNDWTGGYSGGSLQDNQSILGALPESLQGFGADIKGTGIRSSMVTSQLLPQMAMYQEYLSGKEMTAGENAMFEKYGGLFENMIDVLGNPEVAEALSAEGGMNEFTRRVQQLDREGTVDSLNQLFTIAELLSALVDQFGLEFVDSGSTEDG